MIFGSDTPSHFLSLILFFISFKAVLCLMYSVFANSVCYHLEFLLDTNCFYGWFCIQSHFRIGISSIHNDEKDNYYFNQLMNLLFHFLFILISHSADYKGRQSKEMRKVFETKARKKKWKWIVWVVSVCCVCLVFVNFVFGFFSFFFFLLKFRRKRNQPVK